jgi:hypothetical protein
MKYLELFLEEKMKIKILGELSTVELATADNEAYGVSLVIDGFEPGIQVWWGDYAMWLEQKLESLNQLKK